MDSWLAANLVCPRDYQPVELTDGALRCHLGHTYPFIDGIPIMLLDDAKPTHWNAIRTLNQARGNEELEPFNADYIAQNLVDPFVRNIIVGTCGLLYKYMVKNLRRYPIPILRLAQGKGRRFLDIGCNWGRWSISAARSGYKPIGLDPNLDAILSARRVAKQLGIDAVYLVGDARYLPFATESVDVAFSYSVLQHLHKDYVNQSVEEIARVLKTSGVSLIQLPNRFGIRCLYNQVRYGFRESTSSDPMDWGQRYWTPGELRSAFGRIGPTDVFVDGFFSLNAQRSDMDLLPMRYKVVVYASDLLRNLSEAAPFMVYLADSLYAKSVRVR